MQRRGAAKRDQRARAQILAALDGVHARGVRHVLVDHLADAERRMFGDEAERAADPPGDRALRRRRRRARSCRRRISADRCGRAPHRRRSRSARCRPGRSRRPGLRAGAVRPDGDALERVKPRDRAAAGADLDHLDHRNAQRQAAAFEEAIDPRDFQGRARSAAAPCRSDRSSRWCRPCRMTAPGRGRAAGRCSRRRSRRPRGRTRSAAPESAWRSRWW